MRIRPRGLGLSLTLILLSHAFAQSPAGQASRQGRPSIKSDAMLYSFQGGTDGGGPGFGNVIFDAKGNLFGTTGGGGAFGKGTVLELIRPTIVGGTWTETILYSFQGGSDGMDPAAGLVMDRKGNLYGTTVEGGETYTCPDSSIVGCGIVFELSPPSIAGGAWTETVLYVLQGSKDAGIIYSGLAMDKAGNLYGTSIAGGSTAICDNIFVGCGTVFELARPTVSGGAWTESILHSFQGGTDGAQPYAGLAFDDAGNLYGTTAAGGSAVCYQGCGTIFQLAPPTAKGGSWTESILYNFQSGSDGYNPFSAVTFDQAGNLYGTTTGGGGGTCTPGCGVAYELSPPSVVGGPWTETIMHSFQGGSNEAGADGSFVYGALTLDKAGNAYGTTNYGGRNCSYVKLGCGTIFQLTPPAAGGGPWTEHIVHAFFDNNNNDGFNPYSGLTLGPGGYLYGTTPSGGAHGKGTVYRIFP